MFQLSRTWYLRSSRDDRLYFTYDGTREDLLRRSFGRYHAVLGDGIRKTRVQFKDYFDDRPGARGFQRQYSRTDQETRQVNKFRRGEKAVKVFE